MKYFYFIFLLFVVSCCDDNDIEIDPCESHIHSMNFDSMEVGDQFYFGFFIGDFYLVDDSIGYQLTNDTLVLEVLEVNGNEKVISEKLTKGSRSFLNDTSTYIYERDSIYINKWIVNDYFMGIEKINGEIRSHIMNTPRIFYPARDAKSASLAEWKLINADRSGLDNHDYIIFTPTVDDCTYHKLFAFTDNTEPIQGFHFLQTIIYHKSYGITSSYWLKSEGRNPKARGWIRIKN